MIEQLRMITLKLIQNKRDEEKEVAKYNAILKILDNDQCFFQMDIETSYSILRDLGFKEEDLKEVYSLLIDYHNYQNNTLDSFFD